MEEEASSPAPVELLLLHGDSLAAEIARLEAELGVNTTGAATRENRQRKEHHYSTDDDDDAFSGALSNDYDEITVDTDDDIDFLDLPRSPTTGQPIPISEMVQTGRKNSNINETATPFQTLSYSNNNTETPLLLNNNEEQHYNDGFTSDCYDEITVDTDDEDLFFGGMGFDGNNTTPNPPQSRSSMPTTPTTMGLLSSSSALNLLLVVKPTTAITESSSLASSEKTFEKASGMHVDIGANSRKNPTKQQQSPPVKNKIDVIEDSFNKSQSFINEKQRSVNGLTLTPLQPGDVQQPENDDGQGAAAGVEEPLDSSSVLEAEIRSMQAEINHISPRRSRPKKIKKVMVRKTRKKNPTAAAAAAATPSPESIIYSHSPQACSESELTATTQPIPLQKSVATSNFLGDIQHCIKPPNLLAAIQMKRKQYTDVTIDRSNDESTAASETKDKINMKSLDDEAERLQAEILRMQSEIAAVTDEPLYYPDADNSIDGPSEGINTPRAAAPSRPAAPPFLNLLGAIEIAATKRVKRLEETGGELIMQDIAPEVAGKEARPQQMSTSMAEMISQRAAARDKRLAAGGEKRMRTVVIKEKDEYKKDFSNIVTDAAAMGRLTRLNEHTVEAVAQEKTPQQEWKSNGLLAIQWRSNHMSVIHEAARAGNEFKLPEHVVSNFVEQDHPLDWDPDTNGKSASDRMRQLLELDNRVGEGQQKVDQLVLGRKEEQGKPDSLLIKPMQAYSNIEDVKLPRIAAPKLNPAKNAERLSTMMKEAMRSGRPMVDISSGVAEIAWARRARLDRPGSLPKIREICPCPYCGTASPYQTYAYRELDRKHKDAVLLHRQEQLRRHEERQRIREEAMALGAVDAEREDEAVDAHILVPSESPADEVERKRLERQRMREETRKLKQAVAEAEAAVAEATRTETEKQQYCEPISSSLPTLPSTIVTTTAASKTPSTVQDRVDQWKSASGPLKRSPYAQTPPSDAGCKCIII